jgi:hypothetical protein
VNIQVVVPRATRNLPQQRVTPNHNPKYTSEEPMSSIANHDDSSSVNI